MPSAQRNETETKQFQSCFEAVLFQQEQNAKIAMKLFILTNLHKNRVFYDML